MKYKIRTQVKNFVLYQDCLQVVKCINLIPGHEQHLLPFSAKPIKRKRRTMSLFDDFISLIFPRICAACGNSLWKSEETLCLSCDFHLPRTNYHLMPGNPVEALFWGRVDLKSAAAFLYFHKGSKVQRLIHHLKYKDRRDIGIYMGRQYGLLLRNSPLFQTVETIIPVPLHIKKLRTRGYNQSEMFADGLAISMNVPVNNVTLYRRTATETQTKKSRFRRWQNVAEVFGVNNPDTLELKHVLLVDDVITTGATLESCILALSGIRGIHISIAAIAVAPF
jgi:ComF family protein